MKMKSAARDYERSFRSTPLLALRASWLKPSKAVVNTTPNPNVITAGRNELFVMNLVGDVKM